MDLPLERWPVLQQVGPDPTVEVPGTGTMNDTWLIRSRRTPELPGFVLRRHRFRDSGPVRTEHRVMAHARDAGIPVPPVHPDGTGDPLVRHEDRWWTLYGFATGSQVAREGLTDRHARAMGVALGRIHGALADLGLAGPAEHGTGPTAQELLAEIADLRSIIAGLPHRDTADDWADAELAGHADWIRRHGLPEPEAVPAGEIQALHGDYQESNLFFAGDLGDLHVSGVIDWDKAEVGARGFEVVRCLKLSLRFDVVLCRAFLAGYRETAELAPAELQRSVRNEHARALRGLWLPRMIYRYGEDRLRRFLRPGGFRTVLDDWPSTLS